MAEQKQLLSLLKVAKRKLAIEHFSHYIHLGCVVIAVVSLVITICARFFVILHVPEKLLVLACVIILVTVVVAFMKRPTNEQAAVLFDNYTGEERVTTAISCIDDKSVLGILQRRDALAHMKKVLPDLERRNVKLIERKKLILIVCLFTLTIGSLFLPNDVMKTTSQNEVDEQIAKETKKEIKKLVTEKESEALKALPEQTKDIKTSEQLLEKLVETEASLEQKKQASAEDEQHLKEMVKMMNDFAELAEAMNEMDSEKLKQAFAKLNEKLPQLSEEQQKTLANVLKQASGQEIPNLSELTEEELNELVASLEQKLEQMMNNAQALNQIAQSQQDLQQLATSLQQNMATAGLPSPNQLAFASRNPTNGSSGNSGNGQQNGNGQSTTGQNPNSNGQGQSSNGQGNGNNASNGTNQGQQSGAASGSGSGQGSGNGTGTGQGQGSGAGSGSGTGSGSGSGSGTGAGFGQGSRQLTIPDEKIAGEETIENDIAPLGEGSGEQQLTQEGPVLKGSVRSYEQVYGEYEQSYRESVERMDLPAHLEHVVKDYFSDLNPGGA